MADRILTPPFTLAFPNLDRPRAFENADGSLAAPKYSAMALWYPAQFDEAGKAAWKEVGRILNEAAQETFGKQYAKLPGAVRKPLRDGSERDIEEYPEFDGAIFATLSAGADYPPACVQANGAQSTDPLWIRQHLRRGAICRAFVNAYTYDMRVNKGISLGLEGIQLMRESEVESTRTPPKFDAVPGADSGGEGFEPVGETGGDDFDDDIPF